MPSSPIDFTEPVVILVVDNSRAVTGALNAMRHATGLLRPGMAFEYVLPTGSTGRAVLEADGYRVHELPFDVGGRAIFWCGPYW